MIAPLFYAAYALLTPPFQTPDEQQHLFRAWQLSEFHLVGERRGEQAGGVLPEGLGRAAIPQIGTLDPYGSRRIVKRPLNKQFDNGTPIQPQRRRFFNFPGSVVYSPVGYGPQVIAIWVGEGAGLSVENIIRLGRLLNAGLAIFLLSCAIRLTPIGGLSLMWIGLLPMTAASSAAFGQDGLVIGGASLLTAICLKMIFSGRWERRELVAAAVLTILLSLSKILYLPLVMIGGQRFDRGKLNWRSLQAPIFIAVVASASAALWLHGISGLVVKTSVDIPSPGQRLASWVHQPSQFLSVLAHSYITNGMGIPSSLFAFGWMNVSPQWWAVILTGIAGAFVLLIGDPAARIGWQTRAWLLLIAVSIALLIGLALYLSFTPASATSIKGLQGRYFIPVLPAILIAALHRRGLPVRYSLAVPLLMIGSNIFVLQSIVAAYY
ncbi:MAG: DUF2142 domain-containing protein [Sphingomicrobium sp.]